MPVSISRTIRSATSAVTSAEPTAVGITSTTSAPTSSSFDATVADGPEQVGGGEPAGLGRPGAGREGRVEDVDVDREERRPLADDLDRLVRRPRSMPSLRTSCAKKLVIPCSACHANSRSPGPVAAQADLDVARRVDRPLARRAGTSASRARPRRRRPPCPCRCACRSGRGRRGPWRAAQARMSGSAIEWSPPRTIGIAPAASTCADGLLDRRVRASRGRRAATGASPKSTIRSSSNASMLRLEVRPRRAARRADRPRAEARARPVGDEVVGRRADDRDVDAVELGRVLGVREAAEGEEPGVVGLLAEYSRQRSSGSITSGFSTDCGDLVESPVDEARPARRPSAVARDRRRGTSRARARRAARRQSATTVAVRRTFAEQGDLADEVPSPQDRERVRRPRTRRAHRRRSRSSRSPLALADERRSPANVDRRRAPVRAARARAARATRGTGDERRRAISTIGTVAPGRAASRRRPVAIATSGSTAPTPSRRRLRAAEGDEHGREQRADREPGHRHALEQAEDACERLRSAPYAAAASGRRRRARSGRRPLRRAGRGRRSSS